jgi:hypothetical protein
MEQKPSKRIRVRWEVSAGPPGGTGIKDQLFRIVDGEVVEDGALWRFNLNGDNWKNIRDEMKAKAAKK